MSALIPWIVAACSLLALAVLLLRLNLRRWARRRRIRRRQRVARQGELDAERLLRRHGLGVVEVQPSITWSVMLDGEPVEIDLQADLLVSASRPSRSLRKRGIRRGDLLVGEVKTGARAPDIRHARTRRQLLEYAVAYNVDGVLLIDMESNALHVVEFDTAEW